MIELCRLTGATLDAEARRRGAVHETDARALRTNGRPNWSGAWKSVVRAGFRDISIRPDGSRRLILEVSNDALRPISRAVGCAARDRDRMAPLDTREIRIVFSEQAHPAARYDFVDVVRLEQFFRGAVSEAQLSSTVSVEYPNRRQKESPAGLGDLSTETDQGLSELLPRCASAAQSADDSRRAAAAARMDWVRAGALAPVRCFFSLVDKRAFACTDHRTATGSRGRRRSEMLFHRGNGRRGSRCPGRWQPDASRTAYSASEAAAPRFRGDRLSMPSGEPGRRKASPTIVQPVQHVD
jgi:hypothetical protein